MMWNNVQCSVSPFLDELGSTENVEICTGATAWTHPSGETIILIFGQGLWFGHRMGKSLLNPNQCRAYGISLCDDPTDPHRDIGIYAKEEDVYIPMQMNGSFCSLMTRCPTLDELERCRKVCLSSEEHWDPNSNPFGLDPGHRNHQYDEFARVSGLRSLDHRNICAKEGVHAVPTNQVPSDLSEFDTAMCSISPAMCHDTFIQRTIASARVNMPEATPKPKPVPSPPVRSTITTVRPNDAAITSNRHHPVTPVSLAQKFGIGLSTAANTIKVTTQLGVRSALKPLSRRYRTDFMSTRHRRLNCTMYTDTLFAKTESLNKHTCAQLYTNAENFYYMTPMHTNNSVWLGNSLQSLVEDVGIPATMMSDGANEVLGVNSHFATLCHRYRISQRQTEPHSPWQNRAEIGIKQVKRRWKRRMI